LREISSVFVFTNTLTLSFVFTAEVAEKTRDWKVVPPWARGPSAYAPIMLCDGSLNSVGNRVCRSTLKNLKNGGSGDGGGGGGENNNDDGFEYPACIPILRTRFSYVFRIEIGPWFANGALCIRYTNEGDMTAPFLIKAGIAVPITLGGVEKAWRTEPCIRVPKLKKAYELASKFLKTLSEREQRELVEATDRVYENKTLFNWNAVRRFRRRQ
jgi:hypothetical protein